MVVLWAITLLASCVAGMITVYAVGAGGAPQQGAAAAIALCVAVVPYVFTRACQGAREAGLLGKMLDELRRIGADKK